jgi:hypothetical protein
MVATVPRLGSKVGRSQHARGQSFKDCFLDAGEGRESLMLVAPVGQIDTRAPRFPQRAGKRELEAGKVPDRFQIPEPARRCVSQDLADDRRDRVAVWDAQKRAGQTGGEARNSCH